MMLKNWKNKHYIKTLVETQILYLMENKKRDMDKIFWNDTPYTFICEYDIE